LQQERVSLDITDGYAIIASMAAAPAPPLAAFAARLRAVREACGYATRRAFADALGIEEGAYGKYERAESYPHPETLGRIRQLTGATADFLYFGDESGLPVGLHRRLRALLP
jgi:transcriptional regulator with XRE-family HTH domain